MERQQSAEASYSTESRVSKSVTSGNSSSRCSGELKPTARKKSKNISDKYFVIVFSTQKI